ncbi:MAG TPA: type III pantothenate kinase [Gemmatimonadaceae bacterium]|nr:type III pantothenate kinase [Gemmatimonadaceae bacterium]
MILVFDVGNTETTIGLFEGEGLRGHWRVTTDATRTPDEIGLTLRALLAASGIAPRHVRGVAIGSVVPAMTDPLGEACHLLFAVTPVVVDARSALPITLDVIEPLTVGADRIINTLAASRLHAADTIVVDLGTATTYDCITADGVFLGGVIAPGVRTSAETLFRRTSKLPATELVPPARVIGRRTEECIRSGVVLGTADAVDGLVRRIKREWPTPHVPLVIATGGLAPMIAPLCETIDRVEPHLTLIGLRMAYDLLHSATTA